MRLCNTSVFLLAALSGSALLAAEESVGSDNAAPHFQWSVFGDAYSSYNFNNPPGERDALRSFDIHSDTLRLNSATLEATYQTTHFGAQVDTGYGDQYKIVAATDRLQGANTYLSQYFVSYRPFSASGLQFDFGRFNTSIGAEVLDAGSNFNYSRSLLFCLGEPFYHFGLRASMPLNKQWSAGFQIVNGWSNVVDNNAGKSVALTSVYTGKVWGWSQAFMVGPEKDGTNAGKRQVYNEVLTFSPTPKLQTYFEALYGREKRVTSSADQWFGAGIAGRYSLTRKLAFAGRYEYYADQTGFTSGTAQNLNEITATVEYKLHHLLRSRLEYRTDSSTQPYFQSSTGALGKRQSTVLLALLFSTHTEK